MRRLLLLLLLGLISTGARRDALASEQLLRVGQESVEASLVAVDERGVLQFQGTGQTVAVVAKELVRWSTPVSNLEHDEVLLADGSRLVLAADWTGQPAWQLDDQTLTVNTRLFGKLTISKLQVRALVLRGHAVAHQRTRFLDQLVEKPGRADRLWLMNGDLWEGRLIGTAQAAEGERQLRFALTSASDPLQVAEDRVAAIVFGHTNQHEQQAGTMMVGLRDGSLLTAAKLVADAGQLRIQLADGPKLVGSGVSDVVHLRSLSHSCLYLSDLAADGYRHLPDLKIKWPYRRDRNVLSGPLQAAGERFGKGLGMLTAARLSYRLDAPELAGRFQHFVASVAVDDAAQGRGSVIFRVYLEQDGKWQLAHASPVVRGGDPALPVRVALGAASRLALVTDFADRGDELDYANWLEARLE